MNDGTRLRPPHIYAVCLGLIALALTAGGGALVALGGSPYYLLAGLALAASATLVWRGRRQGLWLYAAIVVATLAWSLWEVGFHPWALMPRMVAWLVVGAWMLLPSFRRRLRAAEGSRFGRLANWRGFALALAGAAVAGGLLHQLRPEPFDPRYQAGVTDFPSAGARSRNGWAGNHELDRQARGTRI